MAIAFDTKMIEQAIAARSGEQKWRPDQTSLVSSICAWYAAHPDARIGYDDGQPNSGMQGMIDGVSRETGHATRDILMSFGAAHCLLCDVVPGFRPVLFSAWDKGVAGEHR